MKNSLVLLLSILGVVAFASGSSFRFRRSAGQNEYGLCVAESLLTMCQDMVQQQTKSTTKIHCVPARDRMDCIQKIKSKQADLMAVDPEDMYVARNEGENDFVIFEEIRTKEEPDAIFRYEGVVVVHKDLNISKLEDIKGLKSCHTGINRNVGYKIPITKLKQRGIIGNLADPALSPTENELKAFSELFSQACIVGSWSSDPKIDLKLKNKYANLCALCKDPQTCAAGDDYSGYIGALKCLAHNGGQLAWTKVYYVRKFFGLPVGISDAIPTAEDPSQFAYLCEDGTKQPITGPACTFAARPWQGYMINSVVAKSLDQLQKKIENLNTIGQKTHEPWVTKVLGLDNEKYAPRPTKLIKPGDYLDKGNYTDVVEREYGPPYKTLRICTTQQAETDKCDSLSKTAFSRNIRPRYDCIQETNIEACLQSIARQSSDIVTIDADLLHHATHQVNLKVIAEEQTNNERLLVAIIKKDSTIQSWDDIKSKKVCNPISSGAYKSALSVLLNKGIINQASCVDDKKKLVDNLSPLKCLHDAQGDVTFMTVSQRVDDHNIELLCPDGSRKSIDQATGCNYGVVPPRMVLTGNDRSDSRVDEMVSTILATGNLFSKRGDIFQLFGPFASVDNLIFSNDAIGLVSSNGNSEALKTYQETISAIPEPCLAA